MSRNIDSKRRSLCLAGTVKPYSSVVRGGAAPSNAQARASTIMRRAVMRRRFTVQPSTSLVRGLRFRAVSAEYPDMQSGTVQLSVFLFCFAFGFLMIGKRSILTLSTRALLVVLVGLAGTFALLGDSPLRSLLAGATTIVNALFIAFV